MKSNGGKFCAKPFLFAISWAYLPMASKLGVALTGNPPPTPQCAAHSFAQRGFLRRLGPFRVACQRSMECRKHSRCFALNFPPFS